MCYYHTRLHRATTRGSSFLIFLLSALGFFKVNQKFTQKLPNSQVIKFFQIIPFLPGFYTEGYSLEKRVVTKVIPKKVLKLFPIGELELLNS